MGISLSTEPSIQRWGEGFQGTASPVLGSLAKREAAEKMKGTEQDAALVNNQCLSQLVLDSVTYTADQISTLGAVT